MGCDIHLYVEVKQEDGSWKSAHNWELDEEGWLHATDANKFDPGRNYRLFAMLADVRNGYGFAGIDTGDALNPIDDPRGIPDDCAPQTHQKFASWGDDGHSHSWFTVRELLEYDWTQKITNRGVVSAAEYFDWNRWNRGQGLAPDSYAGDVGGGGVKKITEQEMDALIEKTVGDKKNYYEKLEAVKTLENYYCRVSWNSYYYQMASFFLGNIMPQLWQLGGYDDVRIVFWFDN